MLPLRSLRGAALVATVVAATVVLGALAPAVPTRRSLALETHWLDVVAILRLLWL